MPAKLQPRKRPDDLLRAAALLNKGKNALPARDGRVRGDGAAAARDGAASLGLTNVCFTGFVNQSALPRYYGACDVFVLPSGDEPWGLAINEAMCAGLPIVASSEIGCVPDLVRDGGKGVVFPAGNIAALADALRSLIADARAARTHGTGSRDIIARWSYAECEAGLSAALAAVGVAVRPLWRELPRRRRNDCAATGCRRARPSPRMGWRSSALSTGRISGRASNARLRAGE